MVPIQKKKQSNRRLLSQFDDFDQDGTFSHAANNGQKNVIVNDGTVDRDIIANNSGSNSTVNENTVNVQTLARCFNEKIDREMCNIVHIVEDWIQNAILTAIDNIINPRLELAVRSIYASCG